MTDLKAVSASGWRLLLAALGAVLFTAVGIWMMTDTDLNLYKRVIGGFCTFFSILCLGALGYNQIARKTLYLGKVGFAIGKPEALKMVPWTDVEEISLFELQRQTFVVVALNSYETYLAKFSEDEAQRRAQLDGVIIKLDKAIVPGGRMFLAPPLPDNLSPAHRSLAESLIYTRQKYGGEFLLTWAQRDRPAEEFASYLRKFVSQAPS